MFIEIDESIVRLAEQGNDTGCLTLRELSEAYRKRHHVVFARTSLLERIHRIEGLDDITRGIFDKIRAMSATRYGPLSKSLEDKAVVYSGNTNIAASIKVDIVNMGNLDLSSKTFFICENQTDCSVYGSMAEKYIRNLSSDYEISFETIPGGGVDLGEVYRQKVNEEEHLVCSVADSDKYFPTDDVKATAQGLIDAHNELTPRYASYYVMKDLREIENLIPLSLLPANNAVGRAVRRDLEGYNTSYFDMKEGLKHIVMQGQEVKDYWKIQLNRVKPDIVRAIDEDYRQSVADLEGWKNRVGNSKLIYGFGNSIMEDTYRSYPKVFNGIRNDVRLSDEQKSEWNNIGKFVFEWCCVPCKTSG